MKNFDPFSIKHAIPLSQNEGCVTDLSAHWNHLRVQLLQDLQHVNCCNCAGFKECSCCQDENVVNRSAGLDLDGCEFHAVMGGLRNRSSRRRVVDRRNPPLKENHKPVLCSTTVDAH